MRSPSSALPAPRRVLLGPADVEDHELAAFVAADLGVRHATILTSSVRVFPYDRPAITTAGRYLVTGSARTGADEVHTFCFFVKVIHAYQHSPLRFAVPEHLRARVAALIPWRTEADLYRSDLRDRLPGGLTVPRTAAVRDLDCDSAALWLEKVPARRVVWDARRHARTAYLLGRLAACRAVAPLATAVHPARTPRIYADAWLAHIALPALTGADVWAHPHPLVRDAFDARLRRRLLTAADAVPALLDELDDAPPRPRTATRAPPTSSSPTTATASSWSTSGSAAGRPSALTTYSSCSARCRPDSAQRPTGPTLRRRAEPPSPASCSTCSTTPTPASGRAAPGQPSDTRLESLHEDTVAYVVTIDVHAPAAIYQDLHAHSSSGP